MSLQYSIKVPGGGRGANAAADRFRRNRLHSEAGGSCVKCTTWAILTAKPSFAASGSAPKSRLLSVRSNRRSGFNRLGAYMAVFRFGVRHIRPKLNAVKTKATRNGAPGRYRTASASTNSRKITVMASGEIMNARDATPVSKP